MRFGSLFAGIGGLDLGLEKAGMECVWQVELDDYCTKILEKHWPDVRRYKDVKEVHGALAHTKFARRTSTVSVARSPERDHGETITKGSGWQEEGVLDERCPSCLEPVDLIAGGFPCQPHSVAGKRRGAADDRNLWPEFIRVIRETKPRYILAENVPGIITTYLDTVLSDLEGADYDTWPFTFAACGFDAPHRRERIFVVAHTASKRCGEERADRPRPAKRTARSGATSEDVADTEDTNGRRAGEAKHPGRRYPQARGRGISRDRETYWTVEPNMGRVAHGIPKRVDRLRGLGNAVVPQVAQYIGERILEHSKIMNTLDNK